MKYRLTRNVFIGGDIRPAGTIVEINDEAVAKDYLGRGSVEPVTDAPASTEETTTTTPTSDQLDQDFRQAGAINSSSEPDKQ